MAEFQFQIEDLRWWAPEGAEVLQWPDRVPILAHDTPTEHRAFLTGHTYVYTLPSELERALKNGKGEMLPHFEDSPGSSEASSPRQRLTHLYFREF